MEDTQALEFEDKPYWSPALGVNPTHGTPGKSGGPGPVGSNRPRQVRGLDLIREDFSENSGGIPGRGRARAKVQRGKKGLLGRGVTWWSIDDERTFSRANSWVPESATRGGFWEP